MQNFSFMKMHLKISSAKWRSFCLGGELNVIHIRHCSMKEESTYIMRTLDNLCINMVQFVDQSFYHIIFQGTVFEDGNPCNLFDTTIYILTVKAGGLFYDIICIAVLNFGVDIRWLNFVASAISYWFLSISNNYSNSNYLSPDSI